MGYTWLNVGSLAFGLLAWLLPLLRLRGTTWAHGASFFCCALAQLCQQCYQSYLAACEDWWAIADTSGASAKVSALLLVSTLILNLLAAFPGRKKN